MKETLPSVNFSDLSHDQARTIAIRIHDIFGKAPDVHPILKDHAEELVDTLTEHERALNRPLGSETTPLATMANENRNRALKQLHNKVLTAAGEFNQETAYFGNLLKSAFDELGGKGIASLKQAEKSERIRRLIAQFNSEDLKPALIELGFDKDLKLLETFNNEYETLHKKRITEKPESNTIPYTYDVRRDIDSTLGLFVRNVKWLYGKKRPGVSEAHFSAVRNLLVEFSADLKHQKSIAAKDTAE